MNIIIFILNITLILISMIVPNNFHIYNSYIFYLLQAIINFTYIFYKTNFYTKYIFIPSFFSILYLYFNFILGSYLIPRGYGLANYYFDYTAILKNFQAYQMSVSYVLFSLYILTMLSKKTILKSNLISNSLFLNVKRKTTRNSFISITFILLSIVLAITNIMFSLFLASIIIAFYFIPNSNFNKILKLTLYITPLIVITLFDYENKREILMSVFALILITQFPHNKKIRFRLKSLIVVLTSVSLVFILIIVASVFRGYGGGGTITSFNELWNNLIIYLNSDIFIDGLLDNLEISFSYGNSISAFDLIDKGIIHYQYGITLIKPLFLLVPREIFSDKPYSFMQLYTMNFSPSWWESGGSLPVPFIVELFGNFNYFGLILLAIIFNYLDKLFVFLQKSFNSFNFKLFSSIFFVVTLFAFIRGSGLELYLLYFIYSIPVYIFYKVITFNNRQEL